MRKGVGLMAALVLISGCALQRSQLAGDAKSQMIGKTKEQVLACMGVPAAKAAEGATEVWSYNSGNNHTEATTFGSASLSGGRGYSTLFGSSSGVSTSRFCTVNVTMTAGRVQ